MSNKELIITNIKELVNINKQLTEYSKTIKELRLKKNKLSQNLIQIMESNDIDCFDINNGKLMYKKTKIRGSINKNYLIDTLAEYFKNFPEVDTDDVSKFIFDNRPIKENSVIMIKENKNI